MLRKFLVFRIGDDAFALDLKLVREVFFQPSLDLPPTAPAVLQGLVNVGGTMVAVIRLDSLLGLELKNTPVYRHIVRLGGDQSFIGFLVDRVEGVVTVSDDDLKAVEDTSFRDCVASVIESDGRNVNQLDLDKLLSEYESSRIEAFSAESKRRHDMFEEARA